MAKIFDKNRDHPTKLSTKRGVPAKILIKNILLKKFRQKEWTKVIDQHLCRSTFGSKFIQSYRLTFGD